MTSFGQALGKNRSLLNLDVSGIGAMHWKGWLSFLSGLEDNSVLKHLRVPGLNDASGKRLALLLRTNKTITYLAIGGCSDDVRRITRQGFASFSKVLCDEESIMATFDSNHTVEQICFGFNDEVPQDLTTALESALDINKSFYPLFAARTKIMKVHLRGDDKLKPFLGMPLEFLPNSLAWIGSFDKELRLDGWNLMYELVSW